MARQRNYYEKLSSIDVTPFVEKKGQFTYLSWAWAVDQLRRHYPKATWETKKFTDTNGNTVPYMTTPGGAFVEVAVTVEDVTLSEIYPVLDHKNKSMTNPTSFDVNKAMKRCLAKAIANHGLGLYIYAGEDMPMEPVHYISDSQINSIEQRAEEFALLRGATPKQTLEALGVTDIEGLTDDKADLINDKLAAWIKKAKKENEEKAAKEEEAGDSEEEKEESQEQEA